MFKNNSFEKNIVPPSEIVPPSKNEQSENQVEQEIDNEILILEKNLEEFKQDIENIGGEDALQEELNKNELLFNRWKNKFNRTEMLLNSIGLCMTTTALGFADSQVFSQMNLDLVANQKAIEVMTVATVLGAIGAIMTFVDFIKNQKRVNKASEIISYE